MPNVPHSYEVNGKLVTGNGSLMPISSSTIRKLCEGQSPLKLHQLLLTKGSTHSLKPEPKFCLPEPSFMNSHWQILFALHLNCLSNQPIPTVALVTDRTATKRNITEFFISQLLELT